MEEADKLGRLLVPETVAPRVLDKRELASPLILSQIDEEAGCERTSRATVWSSGTNFVAKSLNFEIPTDSPTRTCR